MTRNRADALALDAADPLAHCRQRFQLPADLIYLDGNSLGALPVAVGDVMAEVVAQEWGAGLIRSWNERSWIALPTTVGEKIAPLLGAGPGQVIAADSTSVNLFKLLSAALSLNPGRRVVLSATGNFPTDLYVAQGLGQLLGTDRCELRRVADDDIRAALGEDVAVLMLTQVDFRSGRLWDLEQVTDWAHEAGALVLWDLAHSAGAVELALDACRVDMAVGCGYKFLNGGPGAPAFAYVATRHQAQLEQPLSGWMGHAQPFAFAPDYQGATGISRLLCGTPPVLAMRALDVALDVWCDVSLVDVRNKSVALAELLIEQVQSSEALAALQLISPTNAEQRGSQVSFAHRDGFAIMQALIAAGVIGDFREPDVLRFGLTPLYLRYVDVFDAVARLEQIVADDVYLAAEFQHRGTVT